MRSALPVVTSRILVHQPASLYLRCSQRVWSWDVAVTFRLQAEEGDGVSSSATAVKQAMVMATS